jgi:hypothetical protein
VHHCTYSPVKVQHIYGIVAALQIKPEMRTAALLIHCI